MVKNYTFGVVVTLFASAILLVVWNALARTTTIGNTYTILGAFLFAVSLALLLVGAFLPKEDVRHGALMMSAIPGALSGVACLFLGIAPADIQHTKGWILGALGLASFLSLQVLFVYLILMARRRVQG